MTFFYLKLTMPTYLDLLLIDDLYIKIFEDANKHTLDLAAQPGDRLQMPRKGNKTDQAVVRQNRVF